MTRRRVERLVLPGLALLFVAHAIYLACVAEDAHITFRFARNVAAGHGFVWNVGEPPVEGYTNFLWVVLCALALRLGADLPLFSQVVGVVAGVLTLPLVYALGVGALELSPAAAAVACGFLAISGPFATWSSGGMETSLFTLLVTAGLYFHGSRARAGPWAAYGCLALATLTRPEGFGVFAIVAARDLAASADARERMRRIVAAAAVFVVPCSAYFFWRYHYFGWLLPNTFYAKTGGGIEQAIRGLTYAGYFAFRFLLPMGFVFGVAAGRGGRPRWSGARTTLLLVFLAYTAYIVAVGGDYMAMDRFFVPVLPIYWLLVVIPAAPLFEDATEPRARRVVAAAVACSAALVVVQSMPLETKLFQKPALEHGAYGGVVIERWHVARLTLLARHFESLKSREDDSVATHAIGVLGYRTTLKVYGIDGLVDPEIAHGTHAKRPLGQGPAGHEKLDPARALSFRPTWFMFSRALTRKPLDYPSYDPVTDAILRRDYRVASAMLEDPENHESGYFTYLERNAR